MATVPDPDNDGPLLTAFAEKRDERAFEELVRRHAGLVLGVCRRVLGSAADAEDAAQAVFLTLARKAGSLRRERSVAPWLHHVARCIALNAREAAARRAEREREAASMPESASSTQTTELRALLDQALAALPERYRAPLVLFHLEERPLVEVAAILGRPVGTVGACLSRGRELLRARLSRRGAVDAAALAAVLAPGPAPSATQIAAFSHGAVAASAAPAAIALSNGALRMLHLAKLKALAATLAVAVSLVTVGSAAARIGAADSDAGAAAKRDLDAASLSKIAQLESQLIAERRDSVSFADLDRCGVLDIAHETDGTGFIFDSVGHVSDKAVLFFRLSDEERRDLDRVFSKTHGQLVKAMKDAGAKAVPFDAQNAPRDVGQHEGVVVTLPSLGADTEIRLELYNQLLTQLGEHRGSLFWSILRRYSDDAFLGFGRLPQTLTVWAVGQQVQVQHRIADNLWSRQYPELPWKYSLFADLLPKKDPAETAPLKKPDSGF